MNHHDDEELTIPEACKVMKFGRTTFYQRVRDGRFPSHLSTTGRRVVWRSDLLAFRDEEARSHGALKPPVSKV